MLSYESLIRDPSEPKWIVIAHQYASLTRLQSNYVSLYFNQDYDISAGKGGAAASYFLIILNPDNKVMALENPLAYLLLPLVAWKSPREPENLRPFLKKKIQKATNKLAELRIVQISQFHWDSCWEDALEKIWKAYLVQYWRGLRYLKRSFWGIIWSWMVWQ